MSEWIKTEDKLPEPYTEKIHKMNESMATENESEAVEICPHCMCENIFPNYSVGVDGYKVKCQHCGEEIMLCDECLHSDDNPHRKCDWHDTVYGGACYRGMTFYGKY